jgi:hypothetical protein
MRGDEMRESVHSGVRHESVTESAMQDHGTGHSTTATGKSEAGDVWLNGPKDLVAAMQPWIKEHIPQDMPMNADIKTESLWMYARPAQDKYGTAAALAKVRAILAEDVARWRKKNPAVQDWSPAKKREGVI